MRDELNRAQDQNKTDLEIVRTWPIPLELANSQPVRGDLSDWVKTCASSGSTGAEFDHCVERHARNILYNSVKISKQVNDEWRAGPPVAHIVSGVRERSYRVTPGLEQMLGSDVDRKDPLWPFEFLIQIAFAQRDQEHETPAIELTSLTAEIRSEIERLIADSIEDPDQGGREADVVALMRDFTILQRLFRAALGGLLGPDFPLRKLVDLHRAVDVPQVECKTPRWSSDIPVLNHRCIDSYNLR